MVLFVRCRWSMGFASSRLRAASRSIISRRAFGLPPGAACFRCIQSASQSPATARPSRRRPAGRAGTTGPLPRSCLRAYCVQCFFTACRLPCAWPLHWRHRADFYRLGDGILTLLRLGGRVLHQYAICSGQINVVVPSEILNARAPSGTPLQAPGHARQERFFINRPIDRYASCC